MSFVDLPLEVNAEALIDTIYDDMRERFPGWEPSEGQPEVWLIRTIVYRLIVPLAQIAVDAGEEIFNQFGQQIVGVDPVLAAPAQVSSTWTFVDDQGYTIPEGTQVDIATSGDTFVGFRVVSEVQVLAGDTATGAGEVLLEALIPGADGNDLTGEATPVDSLLGAPTIALVGSSSGGADAESTAEYLTRLAETLQTFGPHPILPRDAEILARGHAGVQRAVALDNFDPGTDDPNDPGTWDTERFLTLALIDVDGQPVSLGEKEEVLDDLNAKREGNFEFRVIDATYTTISVRFTVVPYPSWSQADADAATVAALSAFLNPATWGTGPERDLRRWTGERTIRFQDLVTIVNNQQPVDHYSLLEVKKGSGSWVTTDVTLDGAAPLPEVGTISAV